MSYFALKNNDLKKYYVIFRSLINPKVITVMAAALILAATRGRKPVFLMALSFVSRPTPAMLIVMKKAEQVWATAGRLY
jgi:hypothetical protein